jgi:adenine specific DNA methylase Mod
LKTCYQNVDLLIKDKIKGKVKLIYVDPPFATKSDFKGSGDEKSYTDKVASAEFIEGLRERLIYIRDILADDGSLYVHCDWRMNSYIRVILDEIFGRNNFHNMISWHYSGWNKKLSNSFEKRYDSILFYGKSSKQIFNSFFKKWASKEDYVKKRKQKIRCDD